MRSTLPRSGLQLLAGEKVERALQLRTLAGRKSFTQPK